MPRAHGDHPHRADDVLHDLLAQLVRAVGLLEPHPYPAERKLSLSERFALSALAARGPLNQSELGELLNLEKSTVSRLVAGLEHSALISREREADNHRLFRVSLTAAGRTVATDAAAEMRTSHDQILGRLTPQERGALATGLAALLREMHARHRD